MSSLSLSHQYLDTEKLEGMEKEVKEKTVFFKGHILRECQVYKMLLISKVKLDNGKNIEFSAMEVVLLCLCCHKKICPHCLKNSHLFTHSSGC
jgi:hypothetical protein